MVYNMINSKITRYNTEEKREKKREERRCYDAMWYHMRNENKINLTVRCSVSEANIYLDRTASNFFQINQIKWNEILDNKI